MYSQFAEFPPPSGIPAKSSQPEASQPEASQPEASQPEASQPAEASQSIPTRKMTESPKVNKAWDRSDTEKLVGWMEDNQEKLRGKQSAWHKDVKEEIFADNDEMTVKRIREKAVNMRAAWTKTKALVVKTGWGLKPEKNEPSINENLESWCAFFWRLDAIWGTCPSATPVKFADTGKSKGKDKGKDKDKEKASKENSDAEDSDSSIATTVESKALVKAQKQDRQKQDRMGSVKRIIEDRCAKESEDAQKRMRIRKEIEEKRLLAEDRRFERQLESNQQIAQMQSDTAARIAQIQAEAQAKQLETLTNLIGLVVGKQVPKSDSADDG